MDYYLQARGTGATQGHVEEVPRHITAVLLLHTRAAGATPGYGWRSRDLLDCTASAHAKDRREPRSRSHLALHTASVFSSALEEIARPQVAARGRGTC
ncbi:hypothetical protein ACOSQ2_016934 [Xanthoceras sorbifolium]